MRKGRSTETDEAEREPKRARNWREIEPLAEEGKTGDPEGIRKRGSLRPRQRAAPPMKRLSKKSQRASE